MNEVLKAIEAIWYEMSYRTGDRGSCVLGAGFEFDYQGEHYFMHAQSPWQGSISWEVNRDIVEQMLKGIGAENVEYHWGNLD